MKKDVYNAKIKNIEDKIPDITNLATKDEIEVKSEIPSIANLATNASLHAKINEVKCEVLYTTKLASITAVENEISNVSNLAKKTDYNTKLNEIESKIATDHDHDNYITTQEFNKSSSENFTARLKQANLASKNGLANFVKKTNFDNKLRCYIK